MLDRAALLKQLREKSTHLAELDKLKFDPSEVKAIALKEKLRAEVIDLAKKIEKTKRKKSKWK